MLLFELQFTNIKGSNEMCYYLSANGKPYFKVYSFVCIQVLPRTLNCLTEAQVLGALLGECRLFLLQLTETKSP